MSFDPQKTDIDEQIDLVATLGNMSQQDKQAKMEKFIETMPTIMQTHLIIEPNWADVTKKVKNPEHIIQKCDPLAISPPILQGAEAVPGLYSHITQSQDQDSDKILKLFKSTKGRGGKKSGKGKQKSQQQPQPPSLPQKKKNIMKRQTIIIIMRITEVITEATNHTGVNKAVTKNLTKVFNKGAGDNKTIIGANTKATTDNSTPPVKAITIITITVIIEAEVDVAMVVIITEVVAVGEGIIEAITITNITIITHMMMAHKWSNMAHHAHFAVVLITLPNIVSKESMT